MTSDRTDKRIFAALVTTLAALALRRPLGMLLRALLPGTGEDPALYYAAVSLQAVLLWGLPALPLLRHQPLRCTRSALPYLALALPLGVAAQLCLTELTAWWGGVVGGDASAMLMPQNGAQTALAVLALTLVPALTEEAFFRGMLQTSLMGRMSTAGAWAAVTVVFALMHGSLAGLPAYLMVSALCGLLPIVSGSLWPGVLFHLSYNGMALLLAMTDWRCGAPVLLLCCLAVLAGLLVLLRRAAWHRGSGLKRREQALLTAVLAVTAVGLLMIQP